MALCPSPVLFHPVLSFIDCCCSCLLTPAPLPIPPPPPPLYKLPVLHQLSSPSVTLALVFVPSTLHCLFHLLRVLFIYLPYPDVLHSPLSVTGTGIKVQRLQSHHTVTSKILTWIQLLSSWMLNKKVPCALNFIREILKIRLVHPHIWLNTAFIKWENSLS